MRAKWLMVAVVVTCLFPFSQTAIGTPVVTEIEFEGVAPPGRGSEFISETYYFEVDYKLLIYHGQLIDSAFPLNGSEFPDNGTDYLLDNSVVSIVVSQKNALPFYLLYFDATEYHRSQPGHSPIKVTGTTVSGTTLTFNAFTDSRQQSITPTFKTFAMPAEWFNQPFQSVSIGAPSRGFAIDNISLRTVPEPSTLALAALGAVGLLIAARRKR